MQLAAAAFGSRSLRLLGGSSVGIAAEANAVSGVGRSLLQDDDDDDDDDDNGRHAAATRPDCSALPVACHFRLPRHPPPTLAPTHTRQCNRSKQHSHML